MPGHDYTLPVTYNIICFKDRWIRVNESMMGNNIEIKKGQGTMR